MDVFQKEGIEQLRLSKWEKLHPGLCAGFTTRNGGKEPGTYGTLNMSFNVSKVYEHVQANRALLAERIDFPVANWVSAEQVHQTHIHIVRAVDKGKDAGISETSISGVDGLLTNETGLLNTVFFADCVPLFFFEPTSGYIGLAHAGWRGTVGRMAEKMVRKLDEMGADISKLLVAVGPAISAPFYEVDEHVISHVDKHLIPYVAHKKANDRYLLDLKALNKYILIQAGVHDTHIDVSAYCTYQDETMFFSHRRDHGKTGRMMGFIGFRPLFSHT